MQASDGNDIYVNLIREEKDSMFPYNLNTAPSIKWSSRNMFVLLKGKRLCSMGYMEFHSYSGISVFVVVFLFSTTPYNTAVHFRGRRYHCEVEIMILKYFELLLLQVFRTNWYFQVSDGLKLLPLKLKFVRNSHFDPDCVFYSTQTILVLVVFRT